MSKRLLGLAASAALVLASAAAALAQNTQQPQNVTVKTQTQTSQAVQNPDGTWTVIEYPAGKEVVVDLTPGMDISGATGRARVMRMNDHTMVHLDLSGITNVDGLNLYAVDPYGKTTILGPVNVTDGVAAQDFATPLNRFMLVLSPESNLTAYQPSTRVLFRSAVPQGFAVVPTISRDHENGAPVGEKVAAVSTSGTTSAYSVPMLNIAGMARGQDTDVKVNLAGALTGSRVNIKLTPRNDGPTTVVARFHELKESPAGKVYVLWAVSPDNKFVKLGQIVNPGTRNEAEIKSETALPDFGLLVTLEDEVSMPTGAVVGTVIR
jgi:hypothetical protein